MTFDPSEDYSLEAYWSSGIPAIIESELQAAISNAVNKSAARTHVRLALERGRVFHQAGELTKAREFLDKAQ